MDHRKEKKNFKLPHANALMNLFKGVSVKNRNKGRFQSNSFLYVTVSMLFCFSFLLTPSSIFVSVLTPTDQQPARIRINLVPGVLSLVPRNEISGRKWQEKNKTKQKQSKTNQVNAKLVAYRPSFTINRNNDMRLQKLSLQIPASRVFP